MSYSVMTSEVWRFDAQVLRDAFKAVDRLTVRDADFAARNYEGVIASGLDPESAFALQEALKQSRVPTKVVDEEQLPVLPDAIRVKRLSLTGQGLSVAGLLGPATLIAWEQIVVACLVGIAKTRISAGVMGIETGLENESQANAGSTAEPARTSKTSVAWVIEIYTQDGGRYSMENGDVLLIDQSLKGLGSRDDRFENLARLIAHNAPHAATNSRMDQLVKSKLSALKVYANRSAQVREAVWLLWYMQGAQGF
jgi:hypothetical protein